MMKLANALACDVFTELVNANYHFDPAEVEFMKLEVARNLLPKDLDTAMRLLTDGPSGD